ncbi:MAG: 3-phosphoshikimate 1-carboxyvinyltransferase [Cyanobacteria bacterium]|nr:3-phosphoshikimate 1-carboxyvinyltransferase [Cyanobacteriota bacterium]MDW8202317.1 3-phosphoshikimate 1-carboxyvinyltransferase [Cyanobacteriota bacterium SKYGB_h_bin112]
MSSAIVSLETTESNHWLTIAPPPSGLTLQGRIQVPGDKSISHRALMLGALATGETQIRGLLLGDDPRSTAHCFRLLGAEISDLNTELVTVRGMGLGAIKEPTDVLDAGNSGTTLRLMLGILASHAERFFTVTGDQSLRSRPMARVIRPLQQMGAAIWSRSGGYAPVAVQGQTLRPIHYQSPIASAQVKSCILLAGLMTEGQTTVTEPALSRDHSERMLRAFGAKIVVDPDTKSATVTGPAQLRGQSVVVPGDISSAAFWLVAGAIVPGADLMIENVGVNPTRTGILEVLEMMEANVTLENQRTIAGEPVADVRVRYRSGSHGLPLTACEIAGDLIPRLIDEIPVLAVAAVFAQGTTVIRDAEELRVKESDRIAVMAKELTRLGAKVTEHPDGLEITGGTPLKGTTVDSHTDHRIAMSLAIAALAATGTTQVQRADAVTISYPDFIPTLQRLCHAS